MVQDIFKTHQSDEYKTMVMYSKGPCNYKVESSCFAIEAVLVYLVISLCWPQTQISGGDNITPEVDWLLKVLYLMA